MEIYGDLDFKEVGQLIAAALKLESPEEFPDVTAGFAPGAIKQGRLAFFSNRVWIAVEITNGVATWVPLTNEINAYVHIQAVEASVWTIDHNLQSGTPVVQVYGDDNLMLIPDEVEPTSDNQVKVYFPTGSPSGAITGRAIVIAGDFEGLSRADNPQLYALEHIQTIAATTWVIAHGLGHYPLVRVFTGGSPDEEILPDSIVHNSVMQTTITFSTPRTGRARLV